MLPSLMNFHLTNFHIGTKIPDPSWNTVLAIICLNLYGLTKTKLSYASWYFICLKIVELLYFLSDVGTKAYA